MNKKGMVSLLCLLVLLVGTMAFPATVKTEEYYPYAYVINEIHTRTGPGNTYPYGGSFDGLIGTFIPIRTRSWDGTNELWWIEVQVNGQWLWVTYDRLDINSYSLYGLPIYGGVTQPDLSDALWGYAVERISCRKGPGTSYESGGTYNALKGYWLPIRSRSYNSSDEVWWVEVLIGVEWMWTPYTRFDSNTLSLYSIPEYVPPYVAPPQPHNGSTNNGPSGLVPPAREEGTIFFGQYEQDGNLANGKEPIEWIVLARDNNRMLLVSKYCLDSVSYNTQNTRVTWENCSLRGWLNGPFMWEAFSSSEQGRIIMTTNSNPENPGYSSTTNDSNQTNDWVFLLSIDEANYYMTSSTREARGTPYAISQRAAVKANGSSWWWLRSPGCKMSAAACIRDYGRISDNGNDVNGVGFAVRPALWLSLWE